MLRLLLCTLLTLAAQAENGSRGLLLKDCNVAPNSTATISAEAVRACKVAAPGSGEFLRAFEEFFTEQNRRRRRALGGARVKRIVGGRPADPPLIFPESGDDRDPSPDPIVFIDHPETKANAKIVGSNGGDYVVFRGIRFVEPPVKEYRFQRPKRRIPRGDIKATSFGSPCPQYDTSNRQVIGNEDCLFLNIYTPKKSSKTAEESYPVLFWIHGGGFVSGSSAQFEPKSLVKNNIIVVTTQYRLGSLGFLGDATTDLPGNTGLFDINAAFSWTKNYIQYFGGDPNRIVAGGHGTGAAIANFMGISHFTKDIISGVFAMSGTSVSSFAIDEKPQAFSNNITRLSGCDKEKSKVAQVKCMQKLPLPEIVSNDYSNLFIRLQSDDFVTILGKSLNPSAVVEGEDDQWFLPYFLNKPPVDSLKEGNYSQVPMLTGVTMHETSTAVKGSLKNQITKVLKDVPEFLDRNLPVSLISANTGLNPTGRVNELINALFSKLDYLKLLTFNAPKLPELDKVVQMTTDALYNLPVFMTSNLRGSNAPTYLYSFEQPSRAAKKLVKELFRGSPIYKTDTGSQPSENEVAHGEDLVNLFDVRSLEGQEVDSVKLSNEDLRTREIFSSIVAEFVRSGNPAVKNLAVNWTPFSKDKSEYVVIKSTPEVKTGFRYCEMGLWTGLLDRLKSPQCNFPNINGILATIPVDLWNNSLSNALSGLNPCGTVSVGNVLNATSAIGGLLKPTSGLGGILPTKPSPSNPVLGLFGASNTKSDKEGSNLGSNTNPSQGSNINVNAASNTNTEQGSDSGGPSNANPSRPGSDVTKISPKPNPTPPKPSGGLLGGIFGLGGKKESTPQRLTSPEKPSAEKPSSSWLTRWIPNIFG
nr:PREDICTED: carboxylesterase 1E [Bemisia tabaci]XP_018899850.1 PREDICTED: carboxylesterase 1E [Bemisia tabaci]